MSDSCILCNVALGWSGTDLRVSLSSGLQASTFSLSLTSFSYDAGIANAVAASNLPSSGGVTVTVLGLGFGGSDGCARVRTGLSGCGGSAWMSDSGVVCRGTSAGIGAGYGVAITSWSRVGSLSFAWSYDTVCLSSMSSSNVSGTGVVFTVVGCGG